MSDPTDRRDPPQTMNANVGQAGEPHGRVDTRDASRDQGDGPSPEELDAREENFTGPRKPMGPADEGDDVPETTPEEE